MRRGIAKKLTEIEKKVDVLSLRHLILKFTEKDIKAYVKVCEKFNEKFPGCLSFNHIESDDLQELGKIWASNVSGVLAHCLINGHEDFLKEIGFNDEF